MRAPARTFAVLLLAFSTVAFTAGGAEPLDPDDLTALLADLEASGGILTAADLDLLVLPPIRSARGRWGVAITGRQDAPPRVDFLARREAPRWSFRLRFRRQGQRDLVAAWVRSSLGRLALDLGGGSLVHGAGLLAAAPGRRSSLAADSPLLPPRPGWRPSTSTQPGAAVFGGALAWVDDRIAMHLGVGRDQDGVEAAHARGGVRAGPVELAAVLLRRGSGQGQGLELRWQTGEWFLAAESARWRRGPGTGPGQAWFLVAGWRRSRWRAEIQAAASDAAAGLVGAARPACLPGWRGRGWAIRVAARPAEQVTTALVYGRGEHRDPAVAAGALDDRALLGVRIQGRVWEVRLRRSDETRRRWDPLQPWLPASLDRRRSRTWLTGAVTLPVAAGEARISWRRLEEAAAGRSLLAAVWTQRRSWGRWRAGVQLAWGDPLDLVAVSAPVPGLVRLRHWGHWRSGLLLGADGGGRWRWQCGGDLRRRSPDHGGDLMLEIQVGSGRSF